MDASILARAGANTAAQRLAMPGSREGGLLASLTQVIYASSGSSPQKDILTYPYLSYNIPNCEIFVGYERILHLDKVGYKRISLGPHCESFVGY